MRQTGSEQLACRHASLRPALRGAESWLAFVERRPRQQSTKVLLGTAPQMGAGWASQYDGALVLHRLRDLSTATGRRPTRSFGGTENPEVAHQSNASREQNSLYDVSGLAAHEAEKKVLTVRTSLR